MDIKKQVEYFKGLPYERQKSKVIEMLKQLEGTHEIFAMLYRTITRIEKISEEVMSYIYQSVLEIAEAIATGKKDEAQEKIKKMESVLMAIRQQEAMEKEREGDPENLLKNI